MEARFAPVPHLRPQAFGTHQAMHAMPAVPLAQIPQILATLRCPYTLSLASH